jgi:CHAT domain-containing protein
MKPRQASEPRPARFAIVLGAILSIAASLAPLRADEPKATPPSQDILIILKAPSKFSAEQQERIQQRDRYGEEVKKLRVDGKFDDALALARKMLAIDEEIFGKEHNLTALSLTLVADIQAQKEDLTGARQTCLNVLTLRRKLHKADHWRTTDAQLALDRVERLTKLSIDQRKQAAKAWLLHARAEQLFPQRRFAQAVAMEQEALPLFKCTLGDDSPDYFESLYRLMYAQSFAPNQDSAERSKHKEELLRLCDRVDRKHPEYGLRLCKVGALDQIRDRRQKLANAEPAAKVIEAAIEPTDFDYASQIVFVALLLFENQPRAERLLIKASEIYRACGREQDRGYANCLRLLSNLRTRFQGTPDYTRGEAIMKRVIELDRERAAEDPRQLAQDLETLSSIYWHKGAYDLAEPLRKEVAQIRARPASEDVTTRSIYDSAEYPRLFTARQTLVRQYRERYDFKKLREIYQKWLEIDEKAVGYRHPDDLNGLADAAEGMQDWKTALARRQESAEVLKRLHGEQNALYISALSRLESTYRRMGKLAEAEQLADKAFALAKAAYGEQSVSYALQLMNEGRRQLSKDQDAGALALYRQALDILAGVVDPNLTVSMLNEALNQARTVHWKRAEWLLQMQVDYCSRYLDNVFPVQSERLRLATLRQLRGRLDFYIQAVRAAHKEIPAAELYRQILAWKNIATPRPEDYFGDSQPEIKQLVERLRKTRTLLAQRAFVVPSPDEQKDWAQQLAVLRNEKENLESELTRRSEVFRHYEQRRRIGPTEVSQALPADTVLIDFFEYSPRPLNREVLERGVPILAFVLRRGKEVACVELPTPAGGIARLISQWRVALVQSDGSQTADISGRLKLALWDPLLPYVSGAKMVLIAPDGALSQFPFAALPGRKSGSYLIEDIDIGYVTSGRQVIELFVQSSENKGRGLLVLGGINYNTEASADGSSAVTVVPSTAGKTHRPNGDLVARLSGVQRAGFTFLPGTEFEAGRLKDLFRHIFPADNLLFMTGSEPTKSRVQTELARRYRYIHLATHGFFESPKQIAAMRAGQAGASPPAREWQSGENPLAVIPLLQSGLALAGASRPRSDASTAEEGILTAEEVEGFDLRDAELVVLSACDTGLGDIEQGQGVLGLQRAFHAAGAKTLVTSLWKLEDAATSLLMEEFYTNLWQKKLPKLEALRQAQLTVLREPERVRKRHEELTELNQTRGKLAVTVTPDLSSEPASSSPRTPPVFWAAFVLSGDVR